MCLGLVSRRYLGFGCIFGLSRVSNFRVYFGMYLGLVYSLSLAESTVAEIREIPNAVLELWVQRTIDLGFDGFIQLWLWCALFEERHYQQHSYSGGKIQLYCCQVP